MQLAAATIFWIPTLCVAGPPAAGYWIHAFWDPDANAAVGLACRGLYPVSRRVPARKLLSTCSTGPRRASSSETYLSISQLANARSLVVVGGTGFILSAGILTLEVQRRWYLPALTDIGWHSESLSRRSFSPSCDSSSPTHPSELRGDKLTPR